MVITLGLVAMALQRIFSLIFRGSSATSNTKKNPATELGLMDAVEHNDLKLARKLIDSGASAVDDAQSLYLLPIAASTGSVEMVSLLLESGVDPNSYLDMSPMQQAAQGGHLEVLKLLLEKGGDPNQSVEDGDTPLMDAACGGHIEVVKLLIEAGADVDRWCQGSSALTLAADNQEHATYEYIRKYCSVEHLKLAEGKRAEREAT